MFQALAAAPGKSHYTITLSAGMLNIPLGVATGTESTRVERKEFFQGDPNVPVGRAPIRKDTGEVIDNYDAIRMAQASNGNWVIVSDDEMAACTSERGVAEILGFVLIKDFGQYLTEKVDQVRPKREKGKPNPAAERAFGMLLAGMRVRKVGALIKVAMRGPARYAILTPEADLLYIYTADAVRQPMPLAEQSFSKAEVAMATSLIDTFGIDTPVLTDETAPVVQKYVDAKAGGAPTKAMPTAPAASDNLMAAFEASIQAAKARKGKVA